MVSELTAARQEMRKASYKLDVVQRQMGVLQKQLTGMQDQMNRWETLLQGLVNFRARAMDLTMGRCASNLRPPEEPRKVPDLIQPRGMELEMARSVEDPRQINLNSTQGFHLNGTPEGNSNSPSTGYSVVPSGWGQNQLPPACLVSPKLNNLNPSHGPELARQCPQLNVTGVVEIPEGNGSGVVWDDSGHIVTNYHVVGNALSKNPKPGEVVARVNILAAEGIQKNFDGKLVGADRAKDLAVLKVDAPTDLLKPINVGLSSALRVGQQCLAIGNPFGFDHTLTVGVISGLNRDIFSKAGVTIGGGVQTDAAINPGNSGGPLLDSKGHMIGINTAIFTQTGTSAGVGFALPSSTVLKIAPQLIQFGKVRRAGLNVEFAPDPIAYQLNVRNGALILQVPGGSASAKAGLVPTSRGFAGNIVLGDIIVAVDGKPVKGKSDLLRVLDDYGVGDKVTFTIRRGTETLELTLSLEEASI